MRILCAHIIQVWGIVYLMHGLTRASEQINQQLHTFFVLSDSILELGWTGGLPMFNTYEPFDQVIYKGNVAQIHSVSNEINISYVENGCASNIFVNEDEIMPIPLTVELLNDLIGGSMHGSDDYIIRFEAGKYTVRIEHGSDYSSWIVSVNGEDDTQVMFLHELQNIVNANTGHKLFLVKNSKILSI